MELLSELQWRGLLNNVTSTEKLAKAIQEHAGVYIGFDPSASSLHLGNFVLIQLLNRFHQAGLKTYALLGGATGMIGDPSGKAVERQLLDAKTVATNKAGIRHQLTTFTNATVLDNLDLYGEMNILTFLRDVGKLVNVNFLLDKEIIRTRLATGISFTEFTYSLIQGNDFLTYYQTKGIRLQAGGSDQWGNITTGLEMIRKVVGEQHEAVGLTVNLLTRPDGKKFGKSEQGAIFLDPHLTSPYTMYQFLVNQPDAEVIKLLKFLTFLTKEEIDQLAQAVATEPFKKVAQKRLAQELVTQIHGVASYERAVYLSEALFTHQVNELAEADLDEIFRQMPMVKLAVSEINILDLLLAYNVVPSKRQARELLKSRGIMVNGVVIEDETKVFHRHEMLYHKYLVVKKGKRFYYLGSLC